MHYVYLLQSEGGEKQRYVGVTSDLKQRLAKHNAGESPHTSKFMPWKSGSGHAFAKKRLW